MQKMDKITLKESLHIPIKSNPYCVLVLIFLLVCGIAAGAATMNSLLLIMGEEYVSNSLLEACKGSVIHFRPIFQLLFVNILLLILCAVAGVWLPGVVFSSLGLLLKGFCIGAGICAFVGKWGFIGALGAFLSILLPGSITLLAICAVTRRSLLEWLRRTRSYLKGQREGISLLYLKNVFTSLKALLIGLSIELLFSYAGLSLFTSVFDASASR